MYERDRDMTGKTMQLTMACWALVAIVALLTASTTHAQDAPEAAEAAQEQPNGELETLRKESERLGLEQGVRQARLNAELADLRDRTARLQAQLQWEQAQHQAEMTKLTQAQEKADAEMAAKSKALEMELAESKLRIQKLQAQQAERNAEQEAKLASAKQRVTELQATQSLRDAERSEKLSAAKAQVAEIESAMALQSAQMRSDLASSRSENEKLQTEMALIQTQMAKKDLDFQKSMADVQRQMQTFQADIDLRNKREEWSAAITEPVQYNTDPYRDGVLRISDRRIDLNGPIWFGTDTYVCDRIHYYNNQSKTEPIFIVIDNSPGGSVMVGYRILKAMEASEAPIHVVVKSFAASMAACITTLADHSYAYPNAIILHHQMSAGAFGNMTQIGEQYDRMQEWAKRLHNPVAAKMGVSPEKFTKMMYDANSDGDWDEFATEAVKLKWVDHVVQEIREDGIREEPTGRSGFFFFFHKELEEMKRIDEQTGMEYMQLPRLSPFDFYYIYNPDNYYRTQ